MLAENALRKLVSPRTAERGDLYYAQGRVRRIDEDANGLLRISVQGTRLRMPLVRRPG